MEDQNVGAEAPNTASSVKANWAALVNTDVFESTPSQTTQTTTTTTEPPTSTPEVKTPATQEVSTSEEVKLPDLKAEDTKAVDQTVPAKTDEFSLDALQIKDAPKSFDANSAQALAQDLGFQLEKESFEDFTKALKENYVPKGELDKVKEMTKKDVLSTLKPEIATALELIDMGVPQEYAMNPTGRHEQLLGLEDAELVRAVLESMPEYADADAVDLQMEQYNTTGQMAGQAKLARININREKNQILETQSQLVQQHTQKQQQAAIQQKTQSDTQFLDHLSKADKFMGLNIPKDHKDAIAAKYKSGKYDNVLNDPNNKMLAIMYLEYGTELSKQLATRSKAEGKAEFVKNMADVPNKKELGGGRVIESSQEKPNNWAAFSQP